MKAPASKFVIVTAAALVLVGCSLPPRVVEREPKAADAVGGVSVAVVAVGPWELYANGLKPDFQLDGSQALAEAGAVARRIEDQYDRAIAATLKLAPGTLTEERVDTSGDKTSSSTTRASKPGSLADVADPKLPEAALPALPAASGAATVTTNPRLRYELAAALFQEVQLLNNYVRSAPRKDGYEPFVVRLQVAMNAYGRNTPYDAEVEVKFAGGTEASGDKQPIVVPLLLNDSMEIAEVATARHNLRTLGVALAALRGNSALGFSWGSSTEQQLRALGNEFNALLNVSAKDPQTLRVRIGAVAKDVDKHELLTQSHMVTLMVLVPKADGDRTKNLSYQSSVVFRHARSAAALPGGAIPLAGSAGQFQATFWAPPRLPTSGQFVDLLLSGEEPPYTARAVLRGGDALVDYMIDSACLRQDGQAPSNVCSGGVLFADAVSVTKDRNGVVVQFTERLDKPAEGARKATVGGTSFTQICVQANLTERPANQFSGSVISTCGPLSQVRLAKPEKPKPRVAAKLAVQESQLLARQDGSAQFTLSADLRTTGNDKPAKSVEVSIVGAGLAGAKVLGGESGCAGITHTLVIRGDCTVLVTVNNTSVRNAVKLKAVATRPDGKDEIRESVDVAGGALEVLGIERPTPCASSCCGASACIDARPAPVAGAKPATAAAKPPASAASR